MKSNPRIIVSGATKGIGRAIAEKFAAGGFDLALCARSVRDLEELKSEFSSKFPGSEVMVFQADLSKKSSVADFANFIKKHWDRVDVLVNNAGLYIGGATFDEAEGALEHMIETNLYSAYHLSRHLLPIMLPQKSGHIFNMCSVASFMAYPNGGSYSISKFALLGFSKVLRAELKEKGTKVTAIMPGATWSDSWKGVSLPEARLMQASDVALAVWSAWQMSPSAVVEEIIIRPQLGDL